MLATVMGQSCPQSPSVQREREWGSLTGCRRGWAEDPLNGFTGAAVATANPALVFPQVRAQDPVAAHVLRRWGGGECQ